jgi:hypothetical protein
MSCIGNGSYRVWHETCTYGKPRTDAWSDPSATPSSAYTEQVNATPVSGPSRSRTPRLSTAPLDRRF